MNMITLETLERAGACKEQRYLFAELFPEGVEPTVELCVQHYDMFDWTWAAKYLLDESAHTAFDRATASARAAFGRGRAPAWAEYEKATATALAEYGKARAKAFAEAYAGMGAMCAP